MVDVAYIGNVQKNQPINFNLNAIAPGTAFLPEFVDPRNAGFNFAGPISASNPGPALPGSNAMDAVVMRPYRGFDSLTMTSNIGKVTYNGLQVSVNKRFRHGFSFDAFYTLSRTEATTENAGLYNYNWEAYSGYRWGADRRHVVNVNYAYAVPKLASALRIDHPVTRAILNDWRIAGLVTFVSGQPFSPGFSIQQANTTTKRRSQPRLPRYARPGTAPRDHR